MGNRTLAQKRILGVAAAISFGAIAYLSGCATMRQTCRYEDQVLVEQVTRSTVLGTGETELATTACAALSYSTRDTGISDNATTLGEKISEGAARGAVGAFVPSPSAVLGR